MDFVTPTQRVDGQITLPLSDLMVTSIIRKSGPLSRTEVAEVSDFSRGKITSVVGQLIDREILIEAGDGDSSGGRRPRLLNFNPDYGYVAGIDLGATSVSIVLADFTGDQLKRYDEDLDVRDGPELIINPIIEVIQSMLTSVGADANQLLGIGFGVPGPVEFSTGLLIAPPIMPGWEAYPIRQKLRDYFPNAVVMVDNDVNVMALGELRAGAGRGVENFLFVKIGTGIGCGIISHGSVYRGSTGCAGDIGHISYDRNGPVCHCGNRGCLEFMAAGPAIAQMANDLVVEGKSKILSQIAAETGQPLTSIDVGQAAIRGDRAAIGIIQECGSMIGSVLATLVNFYNPSLILIGGGVTGIGYQLLSSIRQSVLQRSLSLSTRYLRIDYSPMADSAGVTGAVALCLEHVFTSIPE